ncbi:MAG: DNA adenine methylase [Bacteroidales bacterium]|nr:DNA adenine methylase [Bacteroidales bacterium]
MKEKIFTSAPLPFMGQKRRFVREFKQALIEDFKDVEIVVDLFGGSGLLAHTAKRLRPELKVTYNDYDNYSRRIENIHVTNRILEELRQILNLYPEDTIIKEPIRSQIIDVISKYEVEGYVDYITLSSSLLFSMKYVKSLEELRKQSFYNCVRKNDYNADDYLTGLEITRCDYRMLYQQYKNTPNVLFVIDPPYLSTECKVYENYWKLADYLDVLRILDNVSYVYFTSNKSSIIELCDWLDRYVNNPFKDATIKVVHQKIGINTTYDDIMMYKNAALQSHCNAA